MQVWQEEMIKRLEDEQLVIKFCSFAEISPDIFYRMRKGGNLRARTLTHIKSEYKSFSNRIKKQREKEALL